MKTKIFLILKKELRETFRDKKSLAMMLIIPIIIPLLILGMSALFESEINKDLADYNKIGFNQELNEEQLSIANSLNLEIYIDSKENLEKNITNGKIFAYVEVQNNNYIIHYKESDVNSTMAVSLIETYLNKYKEYLQASILNTNNINLDDFNNVLTYEYALTKDQNFYANYVVNYAFMFIIMAITVSATYPATDSTAGEKERGTLETLLTCPIKSHDIIIGKLLSVTISSLITGFLSFGLTIISLTYVQNKFSIFQNTMLINNKFIIVSIFIIIAYSILISGLCLAIASMAKTFKEAQSALTPLTFISFFPSMIAFLLNINNSLILSLIPFLNFSLIIKDATNNHLNYFYLITMFLTTIILIIGITYYIIKQYKSEKVLFN